MDKKYFTSTNPITDAILWEGTEANSGVVNAAIAKGYGALENWSSMLIEEREQILLNYGELLKEQKDTFATLISKEVGKPLWESRTEVDAMIGKIAISIRAQNERCPLLKQEIAAGTSITRYKPLGVVAVLGPYNFPGHLPNGHIVPALLAGNTVVFKPSNLTPAVGERLASLLQQAGIPEGVVNLVQGGMETGQHLSSHRDIAALLFTGSWNTGRLLAKQFGKTPQKLLALEMGGNNPLVIGHTRDLDAAVYQTLLSAFLTSGQRCTCARRLILIEGEQSATFLDCLIAAAKKITVAPYDSSPEPFMGSLINNAAADHLLKTQETLINQGAESKLLMQRLIPSRPLLSPGILDVTSCQSLPDAEYFGPLLQVIRVPNLSKAITVANDTGYGLAAAIFTDKKEDYATFFQNIRAGVINWNAATTGASSAAPFGGVGQSGNFRPSAYFAADYCNYPIASIEAKHLTLPKTPLPGITL